MKRIFQWLIFLFTGKGEIGEQAVREELINLGGQGRDEYGR
jgi:hypothetical protein